RGELLARAAGFSLTLALPSVRNVARSGRAAGDPRVRALQNTLRGAVITRADPRYATARLAFDGLYDGIHPLAVAQPVDAADVAAVVRWAQRTGVHVVPRSGGHSYGGYSSTPGVVVDLSKLAGVRVTAGQAVVGAGARLGNIYDVLGRYGVAVPAGTCPSVGIGGHALGGG